MRLKNLCKGELYFLYKYGIIFLYILFTILYLGIISAVPMNAKKITSIILIFTDPAAMGLFFMGAVILLEKSQRVESSLSISPVTETEYIIAKIIPMLLLGVIVAIILSVFAKSFSVTLIFGIALSSILFSLCGLFVGLKVKTLNGFMIATVPFEIILFTPSILFIFEILDSPFWILHPGVSAINLLLGTKTSFLIEIIISLFWITVLFFICKAEVKKSFGNLQGIKL